MNEALDRLAQEISLNSAAERLRLEFGYACACRVEQFVEQPEVLGCLRGLGAFLAGAIDRSELGALAAKAALLANQHQGSRSLDGSGHAAVSATYAVANALAGKARQAADYAAYAAVYGQGGYGAVADRESFEPEFAWQVNCLSQLVAQHAFEDGVQRCRNRFIAGLHMLADRWIRQCIPCCEDQMLKCMRLRALIYRQHDRIDIGEDKVPVAIKLTQGTVPFPAPVVQRLMIVPRITGTNPHPPGRISAACQPL